MTISGMARRLHGSSHIGSPMRQDLLVDKKQAQPKPKVSQRLNLTRLLWVLGLFAGIAIGAAAAIGIVESQRIAASEAPR